MNFFRCVSRKFALVVCLLNLAHVAAVAFAENPLPSALKLEGSCVEKRLPTPKECVDIGAPSDYPEYQVVNPKLALLDSARLCRVKEAPLFSQVAEKAINAHNPVEEEGKPFWDEAVRGPVQLKSVKCSVLSRGTKEMAVLQSKIIDSHKNRTVGSSILTVLRIENKTRTSVLAQFLSTSSQGDMTRSVGIEHVCSLNNDGKINIILKDQRYAGYGYLIVSPSENYDSLLTQQVPGFGCD